ncbi:uncharacterized protein LOC110250606 [Exaiptasia diaphana]|uniref:TLDc domain-containing protein n=1 Tax=Exaiptasia diaphana TaxID=2652724 RepID=A0A913YTD5_EXADI|nr:uncharacterized protein LOC110250606 [Exaiptasia diaphana]
MPMSALSVLIAVMPTRNVQTLLDRTPVAVILVSVVMEEDVLDTMEELTRLITSRRAHKAHLTKIKTKIDQIVTKDSVVSGQEITLIKSYIDQLRSKQETINTLNDQIANLIDSPEDLEKEIIDAEDLNDSIVEKMCLTEGFIAELDLKAKETHPHGDSPRSTIQHTSGNVHDQASTSKEPDQQHVNQAIDEPIPTQVSVELKDSNILRDNNNYLQKLSNYLIRVLQDFSRSRWVRCWRAASDGWDVTTTFHPQCDNKGPTVTIVRVGSYIFGGYSDVSWDSSSGYSYARNAFLFTLHNTNGYYPIKLPQVPYQQYSIYRSSSYGPTFGIGNDMHISNHATSNSDSYFYVSTYKAPPGCSNGNYCSFYTGNAHFTPSDVEVFYETTN